MNRWRQRLRGTRVTLGQLGLVSMVSAVVSALVVVGALAETGPEKAVIAALRTRQVIHEHAPASGSAGSPASTVPAADTTPVPTPAPASDPSAPATSSSTSDASAASDSSDSASSDSSSADNSGSSSSDSTASSDSSSSSSSSGSSSDGASAANKPTGATAKVKRVFVVVVSTPSFQAAFGHGSAATYLNGTLRPKGVLLSGYHTLGTAPLPDHVAMVSGQAPNRDTEQDCSTYSEFPSNASPAKDGLVPGAGCIYPNTALTVGDQLDGANVHWRGFMDGMTAACQHPNSGAVDTTVTSTGTSASAASTTTTTAATTTTPTTTTPTTTTDSTTTGATTTTTAAGAPASTSSEYQTSENPFVYFHSLLDLGDCQSDDLPLTELSPALSSVSSTPGYAFIAPAPCDDGTVSTCPVGKPTAVAAADAFLHQVVPGIMGSPAYRAGGALIIAFTTTAPAAGGGDGRSVRTGALILSPHAKPGTTVSGAYDPYSILRTVEDVFALTSLARAKSAHGFDQAVFTR